MANPLIIPCCLKSICDDPGSPVLNLSAELSDGPRFIGISFGGQLVPPVGTTFRDPNDPCFTVGDNPLGASQDADRCNVIHTTDDPGGGGGDWHGPDGGPVTTFGNRAQSCTVRCPDGLPFTFTVLAGTYVSTSQDIADRIAFSNACRFASLNRVCLSTLDNGACLGAAYSDTIIPQGRSPFTFTIISGSLPPGLTLTSHSTFASISGTPTALGHFTFQVRCVSASGFFMQKTYFIDVLTISNASDAPQMSAGNAYSFQLIGLGGTPGYTFFSDDLPDGLSVSSSGLISGTPDFSGPVDATVTITDANGASCDMAISSQAPCPFFDSVVWGAPSQIDAAPPPNSSSFTASQNGRTFEINCAASMFVIGQPFVYDVIGVASEFTTENSDCTVEINVISQTNGGFAPPAYGGWFMIVQVIDNNFPFGTFLQAQSGIDFGPGAAIYNFPVTIPAGRQVLVRVALNVGDNNGPTSGAIHTIVTFGS